MTNIPEGRTYITGEVISVKWADGKFGGAFKILVKDSDGLRYYGTAADSLLEQYTPEELVGCTVTFMATIQPSSSDKSFGLFRYPANATVARL